MNRFIIKILNTLYFTFTNSGTRLTSIEKFFYPLDNFKNWNYIYGNKGFISYQCSLPLKNSYKSMLIQLKNIKLILLFQF